MKRVLSRLAVTILFFAYIFPVCVFASAPYVASRNSDVYHKSTCFYVDNIHDKNKVWFNTAKEAEATGRRGCSRCKPQNSDSSNEHVVSEKRYSYADLIRHEKEKYKQGFEEGKAEGKKEGYDEGVLDERIKAEKTLKNETEKTKKKTQQSTAFWTFCITFAGSMFFKKPNNIEPKIETVERIIVKNTNIPSNIAELREWKYIDKSLFVTYNSGNRYVYKDVPKCMYDELCQSRLKSKYIFEYIVGNFETQKL